MLRAWGIPVLTPYEPANLDVAKPDLVVIGNVIRRVNPEATEVRARRLPQMSFPAALGRVLPAGPPLRGRGGHARQDHHHRAARPRAGRGRPGSDLPRRRRRAELRRRASGSARGRTSWSRATSTTPPTSTRARSSSTTGRGRRSSTSVEFDHADIYRDLAHYEAAFERFVQPPSAGRLPRGERGVPERAADRAGLRRAGRHLRSRRARGLAARPAPTTPRATLRTARRAPASRSASAAARSGSRCLPGGRRPQRRERAGRRRRRARASGSSSTRSRRGLADFAGVRRRQEVRGELRRSAGRRRLRPPSDRGARDDRRHPRPLPGPAALGGLRAPLEHQPPATSTRRTTWRRWPARRASRSRCRSRTTWCPRTSGSTPSASSADLRARGHRCARRGRRRRPGPRRGRRRPPRRRRPGHEQRRLRRLHRPASRRAPPVG